MSSSAPEPALESSERAELGATPPLDDAGFDRLLPTAARRRSRQYWTPAPVARHVARVFRDWNARRILDVGCGPGKFCIVAGRSQPELDLVGMDRRRWLIQAGRALARRFGATNVRLSTGDATLASWEPYDGFYFFNPFAENAFGAVDRLDEDVELSALRFIEELTRVESLLAPAPPGTVVVTYHGLGGPIPSSYRMVSDDKVGSGRVRTWIQGPRPAEDWVWLENATNVIPVTRAKLRGLFASLLPESPPGCAARPDDAAR